MVKKIYKPSKARVAGLYADKSGHLWTRCEQCNKVFNSKYIPKHLLSHDNKQAKAVIIEKKE